jgi:hypothetical protein
MEFDGHLREAVDFEPFVRGRLQATGPAIQGVENNLSITACDVTDVDGTVSFEFS